MLFSKSVSNIRDISEGVSQGHKPECTVMPCFNIWLSEYLFFTEYRTQKYNDNFSNSAAFWYNSSNFNNFLHEHII